MQIDHLVWYCADLVKGRDEIAAHLNAAPAYGGEHPGEATANWLLALGPSTYLEILGRDGAQSEASLDPAIRALSGSGLYHWAVSGADLGALQKKARLAGLSGSELVSGGRMMPGGQRLSWTCFGLHSHEFGALVPFFIDWLGSEHPAMSAPPGARLSKFEVFTPRAAELRRLYGLLGLEFAVVERAWPGFSATLESRRGLHVLHSFSPLPPGYVI